jgi:hypothetical protein
MRENEINLQAVVGFVAKTMIVMASRQADGCKSIEK